MKVELKEIIEQLNEVVGLGPGYSVAALFNDVNKGIIDGWTIVKLEKNDDDTTTPIAPLVREPINEMFGEEEPEMSDEPEMNDGFVKYKTIKELLNDKL